MITSCIAVDVDSINEGPGTSGRMLYADSLDLIDIVFEMLSEEFDISCNENDLPDMTTFADTVLLKVLVEGVAYSLDNSEQVNCCRKSHHTHVVPGLGMAAI